MPQYRVCDIEALIEVYPNAVIFLFRFVVESILIELNDLPRIGNRTVILLITYFAGIVLLERKRTQTGIASQFSHVSHDQLWRFVGQSLPIRHQLMKVALQLLQRLTGDKGWYIVDDLLIEKPFARWVIGLYDQYDHTTGHYVKGQRLVVVLWTNGRVRVPVAFGIWHAKGFVNRYRTKNQIARLLIYKLNKQTSTVRQSYLVCDNWYASKQNQRFFRKLGIPLTTRLRKNAWVIYQGEKLQLTQLATLDPISSYHYYRLHGAYVKSYIIGYPQVGEIKVAVVKNDRHVEPGKTKFLISCQKGLTNSELVSQYRNRWIIEEFFRDCKQHFGLADCQAREAIGLICHFQMVFSTAVLCDLFREEKPDQSQTIRELLIELRRIRLLKIGSSERKPILFQSEGTIQSLDWNVLLNRVRTKLPIDIPDEISQSIYNLTLLRN